MGAAKTFFDNKDVDKRIKCQVYVAGPLNALLWGCESWNLTRRNLDKLTSFHHNDIRRILGINWNQIREKRIKNKEVRGLICNILNIDAYITRRTATYLGKISRSDNINLPKKFLTAWVNKKGKHGTPQLTCNNNFVSTIQSLPIEKKLSSKQAPLRVNGVLSPKTKAHGPSTLMPTLKLAEILVSKNQTQLTANNKKSKKPKTQMHNPPVCFAQNLRCNNLY